MSEGYKEFSFGDGDEGITTRGHRWKGEAGRTYRFTLLFWPGLEEGKPNLDGKPRFRGTQAHYIAGVGYIMNKGPEYTKMAGGEPPRDRIGTIIIDWPTDREGDLDKARLKDATVHTWVIDGGKYKVIKQIGKKFPFGHHDLEVTCTDTQYQKLSFTPCRENLFRTLMEKKDKAQPIIDKIMDQVPKVLPSLDDDIARNMTIKAIQDKLAGGGSGGGGGGGGAAAPVDTVMTGEIDGLVDDLLDT